ncbi:hypothetical protein DAPPUDRAFT_266209 [Daphnia pulex]|uniref:MULE transposase domain-containing protein n=1 Tax=Daphnia pulex TaxID=6669 RepID=E9HUN3_DAPPU|nr:hypothetical protein DAPPUDRAFT_266209 [Daphnia pulex]|eukprot:EFX64542.1 hypothetical protein DAPPUDRAFT_266209 [Daphnia pulex]
MDINSHTTYSPPLYQLSYRRGKAAGSASWCTNVGNERGEIVISVLTTSESLTNLKPLANGLVERYSKANQPHPSVLYTDRDCCKVDGDSKYRRLFPQWENLLVRMDSWHFMRRIAKACSNESHPLYASAIFEWDLGDVATLRTAKEGELKKAGVSKPSTAAVNKAITKFELARHCRRRTRGEQETIRLIESLFLNAEYLTDFLGTPLLKEDAFEIWQEEQCHVKCLQDPVNVMLYTQTGTISKGGTSANDVHFQAYY